MKNLLGLNLEELLEGFTNVWETEDTMLTREILDDINTWLSEQTEIQDALEEKFRK